MNRNGLIKHVGDWITRLGSQAKVAERCGISDTALSQWMNGKYGANTDSLDKKIAALLGYQEDGWKVVTSINNYKKIEFVFRSCKQQSMWMGISNKAGSGKTQTLEHLFNSDLTGSVIFIQAEEWNSRQFLLELADRTCGVPKRGYANIPSLLKMISEYLNGMAAEKPILIIDEADKLKPAAFRTLIPLYNRTEHRLGCVLAGTENLKKEIARGVRNNQKGYDEMDSRLGRTYIELPGASQADVIDICLENGLTQAASERIWSEVEKVKRLVRVHNKKGETKEEGRFFCEDLRRLMRLIKREHLANEYNQI
ncbi:AAA family ATPase [Parabacteroides johnsonii]|uniref:AAA family ATPase n=1 Tax=Parabacteroides johnsonii TaxID=387661 RepID=UPI00242FECBE|nr:AAA family ATPase [Parabacteroides johnsonii]